jgi:hypothetical protein
MTTIGKILILLGVLLVAGAVFPLLTYTTNCGGNSAALAAVGCYARMANFDAKENPAHTFNILTVIQEHREEVSLLPGRSWLRRAHLLVSTTPLTSDRTQPRRVTIVCDTPYNNVPEHRLRTAPFTHAAGFSDGSAALITRVEFASLDISSFVDLDAIDPSPAK